MDGRTKVFIFILMQSISLLPDDQPDLDSPLKFLHFLHPGTLSPAVDSVSLLQAVGLEQIMIPLWGSGSPSLPEREAADRAGFRVTPCEPAGNDLSQVRMSSPGAKAAGFPEHTSTRVSRLLCKHSLRGGRPVSLKVWYTAMLLFHQLAD